MRFELTTRTVMTFLISIELFVFADDCMKTSHPELCTHKLAE